MVWSTCCQCVGGSSGAVDRTSASLGFARLFFWQPSTGWLLHGAKIDDPLLGEIAGPMNSTSNQNANPCRGAEISYLSDVNKKINIKCNMWIHGYLTQNHRAVHATLFCYRQLKNLIKYLNLFSCLIPTCFKFWTANTIMKFYRLAKVKEK